MSPERDPIREAHRQWLRHGWDDAADGMAMVTSVVRAHQLLMERIEGVLRPRDLTFARYEVLRLLSFTKERSLAMTRLGSLLQVHPTSVTSAVDRLVKQGFVERERGTADRRVILATLTSAGAEVVEEATVALNSEVFEKPGLEPADVLALTSMLGALRASGGDHVDAPHAP